MDTQLAYTFIKVAELGNITKAAEQLGYSQGSVTIQIKRLEEQLGVQLFDRIGRGIQLTEIGKDFLPYAADLIHASENADAFSASWDDPHGTLTIEASSGLAISLLSALLGSFHEQYPNIQLVIWPNDDTIPTIERLRQNRSDFAMLLDNPHQFPGCRTFFSSQVQHIFVAVPGDPIAKKKNVPLKEILDSTFIDSPTAYERDHVPRSALSAYYLEHGITPVLEVASNHTVINMLKQSGGRAFLPRFMVQSDIDSGRLVRIDTKEPESGVYIQMHYNESRWLNPQMQAFLDFIRVYMDEHASYFK